MDDDEVAKLERVRQRVVRRFADEPRVRIDKVERPCVGWIEFKVYVDNRLSLDMTLDLSTRLLSIYGRGSMRHLGETRIGELP